MPYQNLADLPLDIHIIIVGFLRPMDIIAMEQTCKSLHFVCSMRPIWMEALQLTVSNNFIFCVPIQTPDSMTLDELRHAATAPARMLQLLEGRQQMKNHKNREIHHLYSTTVPLHWQNGGEVELGIHKTFLVPGGRYVVATTNTCLMVVDLKRFFDSSSHYPADYMVFLACSPDGNHVKVGQAPGRPSSLYIVVSEDRSDFTAYDFTVFEYDSSSHELSVFRRVSIQSDIRSRMLVSCLADNLFIFFARNVCIAYIWDFVRNLYVSWGCDTRKRVSGIIVSANKVIFLDKKSVGVWDIPPLHAARTLETHSTPTLSSSSAIAVPVTVVPRIAHVPQDILDAVTGVSVLPNNGYITAYPCFIDDWYNGTGRPLMFDILQFSKYDEGKGRDVAFRQQICFPDRVHIPGKLGGQLPHINLFGFFPLMDSDLMDVEPYRMVEGRIFISWSYGGIYYTLATPGPEQKDLPLMNTPSPHIDPDIPKTKAVDIAHGSVRECSFDPSSGRLCRPATSGTSLLIKDFLPLPQSLEEKYHDKQKILAGDHLSWEAKEAEMRQWMKRRKSRVLIEDLSDDDMFYDHLADSEEDY
ncbi:hypothetical protein GALMADRAFT_257957 [Galerina marginata CBS 339.88]|uniref:F-box domain-containing protein n=1 Tax=Galerina marginata (strain CBS 339.88) TaxID=685588 RepID=A0A067SLN6_GALM3|nr:hypothetical protein GALMADRAFT_257957 [Galerina marginata CBS 339.88]